MYFSWKVCCDQLAGSVPGARRLGRGLYTIFLAISDLVTCCWFTDGRPAEQRVEESYLLFRCPRTVFVTQCWGQSVELACVRSVSQCLSLKFVFC